MDVFDRIRDAARFVTERSRFVTLDEERLPAYAESLSRHLGSALAMDEEAHFVGTPEETLAFFLTLDSVNFGSGWFPHLEKPGGRSGYFTLATALADHVRLNGPLPPEVLECVTPWDCSQLFRQQLDGGPREELMTLFAKALNELGRLVLEKHEGRFEGIVEEAGGNPARFVDILAGMAFFRDVSRYEGREVPFFKRAQLTVADLVAAFGGEGFGAFRDLERLTLFADNLVPHVLRCDGILAYDASLMERIEKGHIIDHGSPEEVEIRAVALHCVERIVHFLGELGVDASACHLDNYLWHRGQGRSYKARPRHRTRCTFY